MIDDTELKYEDIKKGLDKMYREGRKPIKCLISEELNEVFIKNLGIDHRKHPDFTVYPSLSKKDIMRQEVCCDFMDSINKNIKKHNSKIRY